jgi:hypothetical protein
LNLQPFATLYKSRGKHMGLSIPSSLAGNSSKQFFRASGPQNREAWRQSGALAKGEGERS